MSRKPRCFGETGIYHIVIRGNNRENLFYDDNDRKFFISKLRKYVLELQIDLYAFCLMGNHVHLLIGKGNYSMPLLMKKLACSYVYYFNHKYQRCGHLFQGRYKSEPVEDGIYFMTAYRYIIQNPEKAGICSFHDYKWSSFYYIQYQNDFLKASFVSQVFESYSLCEKDFLQQYNNDVCMEYFYQNISNDDLICEFIKKLFEIKTPLDLMEDDLLLGLKRLKKLKECGISINQISRLTGISRRIIRES